MKLVSFFLFVVFFCLNAAASEWVPPEKPDVQAILDEAADDARQGKYEQALAKQVWFHENALKFDPAMSGVRLSFALGYWHDLGKVYPPALDKLREIREKTREKITADDGKNVSFEDFHDLVSLNRELGDELQTVEIFKWIEERNPKAAGRIYGVSEDELIGAKEYAICGKYLEPEKSVSRTLHLYDIKGKMKINPKYADMIKASRNNNFIDDAATLVALLVLNDRKLEAEKAITKFKTVEGNADFHEKLASALDKALKGELPEP